MSNEQAHNTTIDTPEYDEVDSYKIGKLATVHCEPLFISPIGDASHTAQKENATLTYIRFRRRLYGVTCGHVFDCQFGENAVLVNTLGVFGRGTSYQFSDKSRPNFAGRLVSLRSLNIHAHDIAIVHLPDNFQALHMDAKSKVAIDLDHWSEPDWTKIRVPVAIGFPTEHKHETDKLVSVESVSAYAPLADTLVHGVDKFVMHWTDKSNSGIRLSGMRGRRAQQQTGKESDLGEIVKFCHMKIYIFVPSRCLRIFSLLGLKWSVMTLSCGDLTGFFGPRTSRNSRPRDLPGC